MNCPGEDDRHSQPGSPATDKNTEASPPLLELDPYIEPEADDWMRDMEEDWADSVNKIRDGYGVEWFNRYGEESLKAAMVVSGEIPPNDVDEFTKICLAKAAERRQAASDQRPDATEDGLGT